MVQVIFHTHIRNQHMEVYTVYFGRIDRQNLSTYKGHLLRRTAAMKTTKKSFRSTHSSFCWEVYAAPFKICGSAQRFQREQKRKECKWNEIHFWFLSLLLFFDPINDCRHLPYMPLNMLVKYSWYVFVREAIFQTTAI